MGKIQQQARASGKRHPSALTVNRSGWHNRGNGMHEVAGMHEKELLSAITAMFEEYLS